MNKILKNTGLLVVSLMLFLAHGVMPAFASPIPAADKEAIDKDTVHHVIGRNEACSAESTSTTITDSDAKRAIYTFLVQNGLTPEQTSGIMGNMQAEAGFEPRLVEYGYLNSRNEVSKAGTPTSLDEVVPPDRNSKGQPGYGIIQWTSPGRKQGLRDLAAQRNLPASNLGLQLDYLWQEMNGGYKKQLDKIRATATVRESSDIFLLEVEVPGNRGTEVKEERAAFGQAIFELYAKDPGVAVGAGQAAVSCQDGGTNAAGNFVGFPLLTTKADMTSKNGGQFRNGKMAEGGHPYAAHDIMASTGTPVVAVRAGNVVGVSSDKCGGRLLAIYDESIGVTVSYLHLDNDKTLVNQGDAITVGQNIGFVGSASAGCGSAHLHIDAVESDRRIGCKRESCPVANQAKFRAGSDKIGLPVYLFETYNKLP